MDHLNTVCCLSSLNILQDTFQDDWRSNQFTTKGGKSERKFEKKRVSVICPQTNITDGLTDTEVNDQFKSYWRADWAPGVLSTFVLSYSTYLIFLNSSQSHRIRFMCLSKALKVPMKIRPSCRMHLILKSMCCSILLLLPTVWKPITATHYNDIITCTCSRSCLLV